MYLLTSPSADYNIGLPTSLDEINNKILNDLTKNVTLSNHYSIICLVYKTTLFKLASKINGGIKDDSISVTPILVRSNNGDRIESPVEVSEHTLIRPIIAPSSIERGHELFIPTAASLNSVLGYIQRDNNLRINLVQKKYIDNLKSLGCINPNNKMIIEDNSTPIYLLGFKIVGNNDIIATVPLKYNVVDFAYTSKAATAE